MVRLWIKLVSMGQSERIFYMLDLLLEKGFFTRKEIAERYEVSTKQVWRDIEYMRSRCPIPGLPYLDIEYSRSAGGYVVSTESRARLESWRFNRVFVNAIAVEKNLAEEKLLSDAVRKDLEFVRYKSYATEKVDEIVFSRLFEAMRRKKLVKLHYPTGKVPWRTVEPLRLINYGEIWYLLATEKGSKDFIFTFSVSRIEGIELLDEDVTFSDFDRLDRMSDSYGIWYSDKGDVEYVIRFTGWARDTVRNQIWQQDQKGSDDGKVYTLVLPAASDVELLSRILFYGEFAEPVAPASFVEKYRSKVKAMAARYSEVEK